MTETLNIWEKPTAEEIYMITGWRQWADAGSMSSLLPKYLIQETDARKIGTISPDGFYLFQIPGTHDLVRPMVQFSNGYPESLETKRNEFFYSEVGGKGFVYFLGDEPHMDVDRYINAIMEAAQDLNVKRIISFGGVYAEVPYDKERPISCSYSMRRLKAELDELAVDMTDYQGGAAIGSYLCKRAQEQDVEYVGFYAFAPTYDFAQFAQNANGFRIENDFRAWLGVMRRVNHMLEVNFDLIGLEEKAKDLNASVAEKIEEMDNRYPEMGVSKYFERLSDGYEEQVFDPLSNVWEDELKRLLDDEE